MADPNDSWEDNVGGVTVIKEKKYSLAVCGNKKN